MKLLTSVIILITAMAVGCAPEQLNLSDFSATLADPTTGQLNEKVVVQLIEVETPPRPFTPQIVNIVEEFEVETNETFQYSFNAKRGDKFDYMLRYQYPNYYYGDYGSYNEFWYSEIPEIEIEKGQSDEYELSIVPLAGLVLRIVNNHDNALESDSIWVELFDGQVRQVTVLNGVGKSPSSVGYIPHGSYTLSYEYYKDGLLERSESESVYFTHNTDTTIVVKM